MFISSHFHIRPKIPWLCHEVAVAVEGLGALRFAKVAAVVVLLVKSIQCRLVLLLFLYRAVGDSVSHDTELAQEDLPEEQIDPRIQDLVEGGQAYCCQKKVTVQLYILARGVTGVR